MIREAVILAGGQGTRLRPVTLEIPKPLVPVQGIPIASWLVRLFARHGVERVTVIYPTAWKQKFVDWAVLPHPLRVELHEEMEPMGTLGALVHQIPLFREPVFVTNGDELKGLDLTALTRFHEAERQQDPTYAATIALVRVANPSEYGVAEMDGTRIAHFHEKPAIPPSTLVSSGLYILEPTVFQEVNHAEKFLMFERDLFPELVNQKRLGGCELDGPWYDCGTMERWERAIREWREVC